MKLTGTYVVVPGPGVQFRDEIAQTYASLAAAAFKNHAVRWREEIHRRESVRDEGLQDFVGVDDDGRILLFAYRRASMTVGLIEWGYLREGEQFGDELPAATLILPGLDAAEEHASTAVLRRRNDFRPIDDAAWSHVMDSPATRPATFTFAMSQRAADDRRLHAVAQAFGAVFLDLMGLAGGEEDA